MHEGTGRQLGAVEAALAARGTSLSAELAQLPPTARMYAMRGANPQHCYHQRPTLLRLKFLINVKLRVGVVAAWGVDRR